MHLWPALSALQDKLLEEMWKQQDSLEGSAATVAEMTTSPVAVGGSEENSQDSNPLLERLRALEVKSAQIFPCLPVNPTFPVHLCSEHSFPSPMKYYVNQYIMDIFYYF